MKYKSHVLLLISLFQFLALYGKCTKVSSFDQYKRAVMELKAGDSIVLANGVWKDVQLVFKGNGEKGKFIYLTAETPGKVTIEGESSLKLSGEWLSVSGLVFVNGHAPKKTVIDFKTSSKDYAYNSILADCVIDCFNQDLKTTTDHWVGVYGKNNSVENCYFGGKTNIGTTFVIWPNDENSINNDHHIYRNYFGYRPPLGVNGGETVRIGTSAVNTNISASVVEGNYFERCNGESEIISNKSADNKFLNNTFFECEGSLTLRHGNRAVVSGNWFIGNGKKNTGGVRVINEGHLIYNNFFYKLRGDKNRSPLAIMNGIADSPAAGYDPVKNVIIANNTFADCTVPWNFCVGAEDRNLTIKPEGTLLVNNLVYCINDNELITGCDNTNGITLENNLMVFIKGEFKTTGSVAGEVFNGKAGGFEIPFTKTQAKRLSFVNPDIMGHSFENPVIGAFQNIDEDSKFELATAINCGPEWYKPVHKSQK
jgi:poly(beta-D-mannuronate) lyase